MSRSPVPCPRCGTVLADRRRTNTTVRPGVDAVMSTRTGVRLTCPTCGQATELTWKRLVAYDVKPTEMTPTPNKP